MITKLKAFAVLLVLSALLTVTGTFVFPVSVDASINSGFLTGGGNIITTGAIPFQNGTTGQMTQSSTFTMASSVLQVPAGGSFKFATSCGWVDGTNGFMKLSASNGTAVCSIIFGAGGGSATNLQLVPVTQTNPYLLIRDAAGGQTANLRIEAQKAATGQRFVCIDTNGQIVSSATACVGT